ncbi:unnamed protein product [Cercopithifilaria johnstoni]|uniref:Uncharacterized protein n=1 Tax=Cercopithifilaria johnstoni TaxID=2874296 RepID=A0A8J2M147_9BILA|nr:unnamed protein product [Cercopithifilaria johnstoni]
MKDDEKLLTSSTCHTYITQPIPIPIPVPYTYIHGHRRVHSVSTFRTTHKTNQTPTSKCDYRGLGLGRRGRGGQGGGEGEIKKCGRRMVDVLRASSSGDTITAANGQWNRAIITLH